MLGMSLLAVSASSLSIGSLPLRAAEGNYASVVRIGVFTGLIASALLGYTRTSIHATGATKS